MLVSAKTLKYLSIRLLPYNVCLTYTWSLTNGCPRKTQFYARSSTSHLTRPRRCYWDGDHKIILYDGCFTYQNYITVTDADVEGYRKFLPFNEHLNLNTGVVLSFSSYSVPSLQQQLIHTDMSRVLLCCFAKHTGIKHLAFVEMRSPRPEFNPANFGWAIKHHNH